jgi:hypothetical protein
MIDSDKMLDSIANLETREKCETFEKNAIRHGRPDLAIAARRRALEIQAIAYGATTQAERECLEAIYAYEQVLSSKNKRRTNASRTWPMVKRHGILGAVERAVNRKLETVGYSALSDMGLQDYAFEAVILRHPDLFSVEAVAQSKARMKNKTTPAP